MTRRMPGTETMQLTDEKTAAVPGVHHVHRQPANERPLLEQRLDHYANCFGEWLLVDTDVSIVNDVKSVFDDPVFDVALCDRNWPHLPQPAQVLLEMPFNTGVVFSRQTATSAFWRAVLAEWKPYQNQDWFSEQRAVWAVVRSGAFRIKILPGMVYNYPPIMLNDPCHGAKIRHYKGPQRKEWLTQEIYSVVRSA